MWPFFESKTRSNAAVVRQTREATSTIKMVVVVVRVVRGVGAGRVVVIMKRWVRSQQVLWKQCQKPLSAGALHSGSR